MTFIRSRRQNLYKIVYCCLVLHMAGMQRALAEADTIVEAKVKAGYLYNFTKFVNWPDFNGPTFDICIAGNDLLANLLDPIEQKTAFGRPIRLYKLNKLGSSVHCDVFYTGTTVKDISMVRELISAQKEACLLTVGEAGSIDAEQNIINFVNRDGKIKLQINQHRLKQSNLKLSSKLLEVAELTGDSHD